MFDIVDHKKNKYWYYLTPALFFLTIFTFYPLTKIFVMSFTKYDKFKDIFQLKMINNYGTVFRDMEFQWALKNTLLLVFITVPLSIIISLVIALALNNVKNYFFKNTCKTFFFLPLISNNVIMGMIFSIFFYYNFGISSNKPSGLFNSFISFFGFGPYQWVNSTAPYANKMFVLVLYNIWNRVSFKIFVFILALQDINKSYYQAAKIDGTSKWRIFTKITLPLIAPIIFYQFIIEMLAVFKEYESVVGLFGDNHNFKIRTIVGYIYNQLSSTTHNSYSKGTAAAMILFIISILFTTISYLISRKKID
ncbi:carbohydrate ABC transporter permease [Columbia Basin potato purple top phytoplasma]|uniref:Sugar ABC transporter permease n=1 Tax=Columbia Basin potato purple top phytoplasma TaxID=307134 RepID=A0ABT5L8A1_9MOLU|nr:sugar ABC transporter permease [Columbia Basin potato purple top phytoplasma]MDC9031895.1 sugar ABC transporter permease [Columbia Basin potato purple top phytoplasma]